MNCCNDTTPCTSGGHCARRSTDACVPECTKAPRPPWMNGALRNAVPPEAGNWRLDDDATDMAEHDNELLWVMVLFIGFLMLGLAMISFVFGYGWVHMVNIWNGMVS